MFPVRKLLHPPHAYLDREEARRGIFHYIEMFSNTKRRRCYAKDISPVAFENQYFNRPESVEKSRDDSVLSFHKNYPGNLKPRQIPGIA